MKYQFNKQCYRCNQNASSKEHVPPPCLFPEIKDTRGINFRKNLITVPSCDLHNSAKSDDDEFLMLSLAGLIKNNPVGMFHQITKATRALKRKNKDFINKEVLRNRKYGKIRTDEGKWHLISVGNPNISRLSNCFEQIAHGLYFHEFNKRFNGEIRMILSFIDYTDQTTQIFKEYIEKRFTLESKLNRAIQGENPEVFNYCFHNPDEFGIIGLRTVIYGGADVYYSFIPSDLDLNDVWLKKLFDSSDSINVTLGKENFELKKLD